MQANNAFLNVSTTAQPVPLIHLHLLDSGVMASNSLSNYNEVDEETPLIGSRPTTEPNGTAHGTQPGQGNARSLLRNPRFYRGFPVIFIAGVCLAISDSLIQAPFVRFCKEVICCDALGGREGCRDYKRCEEDVGQIVNHKFSSLVKMQTISNSVFGSSFPPRRHLPRRICLLSRLLSLAVG